MTALHSLKQCVCKADLACQDHTHTVPAGSHHALVGGRPVDVQALQQRFWDLDLLCCSVVVDIQALAELSHRLRPVTVSEGGAALIEQVAH